MRKLLVAIILVISLVILIAAMDQSFIMRIKQDRYFDHLVSAGSIQKRSFYQRLLIRSDRWRFGDLYGLCYLPGFKMRLAPFKKYAKPDHRPVTNKNLYIIGDSFLADKTLSGAFSSFDDVIFLDRRFPFGPISLDSTKKNYLVLEFAERNLNDYSLEHTPEVRWTASEIKNGSNFNRGAQPPGANRMPQPASLLSRTSKILFNKDLSRNLELLLFDDKVLTPVKEARASLNYALFGRVAKEVAVSTKKDRLFLNSTVDTADAQSAFRKKSAAELNDICKNLDVARKYYQSMGFKKVYLAIIPNPVALYDSTRMPYNHLLERMEYKTTLSVISVSEIYKHNSQNLYYRSDAHWNPSGLDIWVKKANQVFQTDLANTKNMRNKR